MAKGAPELDLAVMLGAPKKGGKGMPPASDLDDMEGPESGVMESEGGEELPPGFAVAADEAFDPEATPEQRNAALYRAILACKE